jgi:hypothetical protein
MFNDMKNVTMRMYACTCLAKVANRIGHVTIGAIGADGDKMTPMAPLVPPIAIGAI